MTTVTESFTATQARWVCGVVRSGYHNGAQCRPQEPHSGWGCGWRCELSVPVDSPEVVMSVRWTTAEDAASSQERRD
jgi:hypothetical protein